jgi:hypothetical protein
MIANAAKRAVSSASRRTHVKKPYKIGLFLQFSLYIPFPILVS